MKKKYARNYELYYSGGRIRRDYDKGMWVCQVKAKSIKQAYFLLLNKKVVDSSGCGIVRVDNSIGPFHSGDFPFNDSLYPAHWTKPTPESIEANREFEKIIDERFKNSETGFLTIPELVNK